MNNDNNGLSYYFLQNQSFSTELQYVFVAHFRIPAPKLDLFSESEYPVNKSKPELSSPVGSKYSSEAEFWDGNRMLLL